MHGSDEGLPAIRHRKPGERIAVSYAMPAWVSASNPEVTAPGAQRKWIPSPRERKSTTTVTPEAVVQVPSLQALEVLRAFEALRTFEGFRAFEVS